MSAHRLSRPNIFLNRLLVAIVLLLTSSAWTPSTQAAPILEFDFGRVVVCRDVTHLELAEDSENQMSLGVANADAVRDCKVFCVS